MTCYSHIVAKKKRQFPESRSGFTTKIHITCCSQNAVMFAAKFSDGLRTVSRQLPEATNLGHIGHFDFSRRMPALNSSCKFWATLFGLQWQENMRIYLSVCIKLLRMVGYSICMHMIFGHLMYSFSLGLCQVALKQK